MSNDFHVVSQAPSLFRAFFLSPALSEIEGCFRN